MPHFEGPKQNKNMVLIRDGVKKKNGKISDIEQKGGRGLSQFHYF